MVMLAAALLLVTTQADGDWRPMPASATMSRVFFGCGTFPEGDYYSLLLGKGADREYVEIVHVPRGENTRNEMVLTGALQSLAIEDKPAAVRYRAMYDGNDQAGIPTQLTVVMTAPQPAASIGVRTATFTLVRGNRTTTQSCSAAPPPPEPAR